MTDKSSITLDIKKLAIIIPLIFAIIGSGWGAYNVWTDFVDKLATKTEVAVLMNDQAIEIVNVAIMGYEDDLVELTFLVESGEATPMDRVKHQNTISRLADLRARLGRLEDLGIELQRTGSLEIFTGSQVDE